MASELTYIALILFAVTSTLQSINAITVVSGPTDIMVNEGDTVEMHCTISNKGNFLVHWLHENQYLTLDYEFYTEASNPRYSIIANGKQNVEFTLRITNVQLSDAGRYQCGHYQPTPSFQTGILSVSRRVSLPQGQQPPRGPPRCEISPENAQIGDTVKLNCTSQGGDPPGSLIWLRSGEAITGEQQSEVVVDRSLREEHNGVRFRCRLTHPALESPRFCGITPINIPPTARLEPPQVTSNVGQGALYTCFPGGIPQVSDVKFFFDDVDVTLRPDADRFAISTDFNRTLTIKTILSSDNNLSVRCDVFIPSGLSASASALLCVEGVACGTTSSPNGTSSSGLSRSNFYLIIIIVGTVIGQVLLVVLVFTIHRCLQRKQNDSMKMMNMEWKGITNSRRDPHEIVPGLSNLTAPRRYVGLQPDEVAHPRYQDLENNSASASSPPESSQMEMGIYEGVGTREPSGPRLPPGQSSTPISQTPVSLNSPKHPPPRTSPNPSKSRLSGDVSSSKLSSPPPTHPPPRVSPRLDGPRESTNSSDGEYRRPTSNALSSAFGETASYQGSVIKQERDSVCYDEPPVEYIEPLAEGDTVYEVPPDSSPDFVDGYVLPNPKSTEDSDIDDYELPPSGDYVPV